MEIYHILRYRSIPLGTLRAAPRKTRSWIFFGMACMEHHRQRLDDTENASRTTNKDNFVDTRFVDLGILEDYFDGFEHVSR